LIETDEPHTLVVLTEEELVLVDLETQGWPTFSLPYFNSLHCSPITCSQHVGNIPDGLWQKIADAGQAQTKHMSTRVWKYQSISCHSFQYQKFFSSPELKAQVSYSDRLLSVVRLSVCL
jgi:hypothetical protein